jgi:hydrogenase maturation protease
VILVGGVGQLYQGDLDLGRRAAERLAREQLGEDVVVEDLYYGAVAVAQRLEELRPDALVLVGAEPRGRRPGTVERRPVERLELTPAQVQAAVGDAVTGYVAIDLVLEVAHGLGALPPQAVAIEVEPAAVEPSLTLSLVAEQALERALALVRDEVRAAARPA